MKEGVAFIAGHQVRSSGQLVLTKPELNSKSLKGFGKAFLKGSFGGWEWSAECRISCTVLRLADGEAAGWSHRG